MPPPPGARQEAAQRTREAVLTAAAHAFVDQGVQAPIRDIAARAGVGLGTVYRHFPSRADLVVAVYRRQLDECVALADRLTTSPDAVAALSTWVDAFTEFLVTKHGLGAALQSDDPGLASLHTLMLDTLVPACASLLDRAAAQDRIDRDLSAYTFMRAVGNLCILGPGYDRDDARSMVHRLLAGCRTHP